MKKKLMFALLALALLVPGWTQAAVEAGAGNITLLGHIDFVGRYSAEDEDNGWMGYETYNLEFAVLGIAGQVGDNVSWVITEAFTFVPQGSLYSAAVVQGAPNELTTATLLDARINIHLGENFMLSAGRFIPPTSMTWNPHQMKVLHTINYPLINGSGLQAAYSGAMMVPLPMYQTGVMLTAMMGPVSLQVGNFNGTDIFAGPDAGGIAVVGMSNMVDVDKTKGTAAKLALDMEGFHLGGWYYGETASATFWDAPSVATWDARIDQWGAEVGLTTDMFLLQGQYLSTNLDPMDTNAGDDLVQNGWYALAGVNLGPAQVVYRYDYMNYDQDESLVSEDMNEESASTIGLNFKINDQTTAGLDYTFRDVEDWDANVDELAFILEVDLF